MLFLPHEFLPTRFVPRDFFPSDARSYWIFKRPAPDAPDTVVTVLPPGSDQVVIEGEPNTVAYIYPRAMSRCAVFDDEPIAPKLKRVAFDDDGHLILPTPNAPIGLRVEQAAGGELVAYWGYVPAGQAAPPEVFNVYRSLDEGATFALHDEVAASGARRFSASLGTHDHGTVVIVRVRAQSEHGAEEPNTHDVAGIADAEAPPAPTRIIAEAQRE